METYRILSGKPILGVPTWTIFVPWPSPMQGSRYQWTSQPSTRRWGRGRCLSSSPSSTVRPGLPTVCRNSGSGCGGGKFWSTTTVPPPTLWPWRTGRTVIAPCAVTSRFQTTSPCHPDPGSGQGPAQFGRRGRGGCLAPPLHLHPALGALRGPCPAHPQPGRHQPTDHLGRFRREGDRVVLPVSLLCHHGLVDGLHMAHFYANLERELAQWVEKE